MELVNITDYLVKFFLFLRKTSGEDEAREVKLKSKVNDLIDEEPEQMPWSPS